MPDEPTITDRGFKHMPPIDGTYHGTSVRVYESSAALGPHLWVRAMDGQDDTCVHLTLEGAQRLVDQLSYLIEHHYQL